MKYLTVQEAYSKLEPLRISQRTFYRWIEEGRIKSLRPSRKVIRIPEEEINKIIS